MSFKSEHERSFLILSPRSESFPAIHTGYASLYHHIITPSSVFAINPVGAVDEVGKRFIYRVLSAAHYVARTL